MKRTQLVLLAALMWLSGCGDSESVNGNPHASSSSNISASSSSEASASVASDAASSAESSTASESSVSSGASASATLMPPAPENVIKALRPPSPPTLD